MDPDDLSWGASFEAESGVLPGSSSSVGGTKRRRPPGDIGTPAAAHDLEQLRINTLTTMMPERARDTICLCTPAPKIPRPRNAFILYRQHHQAKVTADNPNLSNPEISKFIGEKWKDEVADIKNTWKRLAEEEKQRHQHQYPNYRYQPRRGAKSQSWPGSSSAEDQARCARCNGRLLATPRTPAAPLFPPVRMHMSDPEPHTRPSLHRLDTDIPRRESTEISPMTRLPVPGALPSFQSPVELGPTSAEVKRRRTKADGHHHWASERPDMYGGMAPGELMRLAPEGGPPSQPRPYSSPPLPDPRSFPMPPPPRPWAPWPWGGQSSHRWNNVFNDSVRLPPLRTVMPPSAPRHAGASLAGSPIPRQPPAAGKENSGPHSDVSFKQKLGVLARICRPVPAIGEGPSVRGAFIAVEGSNASVLREVGAAVEKLLLGCRELSLRVWTNDRDAADVAYPRDHVSPTTRASRELGVEDLFSPCFRTALSWQEKSKQIVRHVTGGKESYPAEKQAGKIEQPAAQRQGTNKGKSLADEQSHAPRGKTPVALIKEGFSLTLSDKFACATPIVDMYEPVGHWQWMASLWRGVACPDLVVYAKPSEEDEIGALGAVEFSRQLGLIVVRAVPGKGLDEATERRLAFEVTEWMREGSFRGAVPPNWRLE